jgi:thioesterase domain-containing protein
VHLVGHSYGGCLAYYLVSELRDRGHEVAGLVLLDAVEPLELAEELAGTKDFRMWEFLTHVAAVFPEATERWADALPGFPGSPEDIVAEAERLLDADVRTLFDRGLVRAFQDYLRAADVTWPTPNPVSCPALLVNAARTADGGERHRDLGWAGLLGAGLASTAVDATHIGMVQAPHAADLAALMSDFFAETPPVLYPARVS